MTEHWRGVLVSAPYKGTGAFLELTLGRNIPGNAKLHPNRLGSLRKGWEEIPRASFKRLTPKDGFLGSWGMHQPGPRPHTNIHYNASQDGRQTKPEKQDESSLPDAPRNAVLRAIREGELGKATRLLDALWGDVDLAAAKLKIPSLFPGRLAVSPCPWQQHIGEDFTAGEVRSALASFPKG